MGSLDDSLSTIAKSAGIVLIGSTVGRALGLITEALIARSLDPAVFGQIAFAYTIVGTMARFFQMGLNQGLPRLIPAAKSAEREESLIQSAYLITIVVGTLGMILIAIVAQTRPNLLGNRSLLTFIFIFSPLLILRPTSRIFISVLRSWEMTAHAIFSRAIASRTLGFVLWGALILLGFRIESAIGYWLGVPAISMFLAGYFINRQLSIQSVVIKGFDWDVMRNLLSFSWPLAISTFMFMFLSQMDILMIGFFLSSADVGYYRAISPLRQVISLVLQSFGFLFLPLATTYYEDKNIVELEKLFKGVTKWVVIVTLPAILGLALFSQSIVLFLFGEKYLPSALPLSILISGLSVRSFTGLNDELTKAIDRPRVEMYSAFAGVLANFVLNVTLIPQFGLAGAAIATTVGYTVYNAVELYAIHKHINITPFTTSIFKPALVTIIWGIIVARLLNPPLRISVVVFVTIITGAVAILALPLTGSVETSDRLLLKKFEESVGYEVPLVRTLFGLD